DVPQTPPAGTLFLADTTWTDLAPNTDIDTLILGPSANAYQFAPDGPVGAPYILDTVGKSPNTNVSAGKWAFNTSSGGAEDLVTGPVQQGLHEIVTHEVKWQGDRVSAPFKTTVGAANVTPAAVDQPTSSDSGSFDVTFRASVDLPGLTGAAFGLSQP